MSTRKNGETKDRLQELASAKFATVPEGARQGNELAAVAAERQCKGQVRKCVSRASLSFFLPIEPFVCSPHSHNCHCQCSFYYLSFSRSPVLQFCSRCSNSATVIALCTTMPQEEYLLRRFLAHWFTSDHHHHCGSFFLCFWLVVLKHIKKLHWIFTFTDHRMLLLCTAIRSATVVQFE